jgi:DNA polymerase
MDIVAHVHDEVIVECTPDTTVEQVCSLMEKTPEWAEGLLLRADGYECEFYMKQ